tara:strand:+ start:1316 stop:3094 length:1779 start_codon:yes stop_codon:yes gene_type:complete
MFNKIKNELIYLSTLRRILSSLKLINNDEKAIITKKIAGFAETNPQSIAIYYEDREVSYKELMEGANRYSHWFLKNNLKKGDVIALLMENRPEFLMAWIGVAQIGGTTALINTNLTEHPLNHSLSISGAKNLILGSELINNFNTTNDSIKDSFQVWVEGESNDSKHKKINDVLEDLPTAFPNIDYDVVNHDVALYIYTSGTTGDPKAATITHKRLRMMLLGFVSAIVPKKSDRIYNVLPLYHSAGGIVAVGIALTTGASLVLKRKFSVNEFWTDVNKYQVTIFQYIGELCRYLLNAPQHEHENKHKLRIATGNGLRPDIWDTFKERFNIKKIIEFYGATEGNISLINYDGKSGAIGRIPGYLKSMLNIEIVKFDVEKEEPIRNEEGFCIPCEIGEVGEALGEIQVDAGGFDGYVDKQATQKKILTNVFENGDQWFRSGDLLSCDKDGYYYFIDRIGDTFRWKGENVATSEVAHAFKGIDGIEEVNVYGVEIPGNDGKAGMAALVTKNDINFENLFNNLKGSLPSYAMPLLLRVKKEIEITGTFKHKKVDLVKEGFNPDEVSDPLYLADNDNSTFIKLDKNLYQKLMNQKIRL